MKTERQTTTMLAGLRARSASERGSDHPEWQSRGAAERRRETAPTVRSGTGRRFQLAFFFALTVTVVGTQPLPLPAQEAEIEKDSIDSTAKSTGDARQGRGEIGGSLSDDLLDGLRQDNASPQNPLRRPPLPEAEGGAGEDLGQPTDPFQRIATQMQAVAERLEGKTVDSQTRTMQAEIVASLSDLIDQLAKQSSATSRTEQQQEHQQQAEESDESSTRPEEQLATESPAEPSSDAADTSRAGDEDTARDALERMWGHLPERLREEIQSPLREEFLPAYRELIIEYYKRLAQSELQ